MSYNPTEDLINDLKHLIRPAVNVTDKQVQKALNQYLEENPIESATVVVEDGVLKVT